MVVRLGLGRIELVPVLIVCIFTMCFNLNILYALTSLTHVFGLLLLSHFILS